MEVVLDFFIVCHFDWRGKKKNSHSLFLPVNFLNNLFNNI